MNNVDKSAQPLSGCKYSLRFWFTKHKQCSIPYIDSHKFSRQMSKSIEIEKHNTIDQEENPLDSTWRALFNVQN